MIVVISLYANEKMNLLSCITVNFVWF